MLYKELTIENGVISLTMLNGVVNAAIQHLAMAGGTVDSQVTIDASGPQAALPLLQTFAGTDRLSGTANFEAQGQATGATASL